MKAWLLLALAVVSEVIADSSLKASQGFTRLAPSILAVVGYLSALFLFSTSLKTLPLSLAYSVWAGLGITGAVLVGVIFWREHLTPLHIVAIALILSGVVLLNYASPSAR
jgi:multidrug transporter EmrE-like cation transporter